MRERDPVLVRQTVVCQTLTDIFYIKPRTPELNGKVERSHRSDQEEFYQLLTYTGDVDLNKKLEEWERYYNYHRPHGAFQGKTPYEMLRSLIQKP